MQYFYAALAGTLIIMSLIVSKSALSNFENGKTRDLEIHYLNWALGVYKLLWLATLWGWGITYYYLSPR